MNATDPKPEQPEQEGVAPDELAAESAAHAASEAPEAQADPHADLAAAAAQAGIGLAADTQEEIAQLQSELAATKDQVIRAVAEVENIRKRSAREIEDAKKFAVSGFAKELVDVLDNLHRALESVPEEAAAENAALKSLSTGVEMTLKSLENAFGKFGIERVQPLGQKFDHNFHQAVVQIEDPNAEAGTVVQVLQAGYVLHGRLLRPAMVGVAKGGAPIVDTEA